MFEPYVIQILPKLLTCYGDSAPDVRDAAAEAGFSFFSRVTYSSAKAIMGQLSPAGVRLVLPALRKGTEEGTSWRSKKVTLCLL